ncbi:Crp/Fnr family transcriptional regulator [Pedobacter sp. BMA]|uniref:Crp/Fnr family transcriptional regulator n=1 Tax=Pedobacter sp. BMA TaxID=1663685 RepID=UPI00064A5A5A|nr:Crp/Fnr family transcriptional regulator [Pedobacter sp. BMA]KLT66978.1 hypothetical protein AB669_03385 [Pedobacter sp. BMA]
MPGTDQQDKAMITFLNGLVPLTTEIIQLARRETFRVAVGKNTIINDLQDQQEDCVFFMIKGLVRGFINDNQKDITVCFVEENNMFGNIRNPAASVTAYPEQFQTIEDSEILIIPYRFIDELYHAFPETNVLARKLLAIHFHISQERSVISRIPSAESRYKQFVGNHPSFSLRVPLKYLASYLGMRVETLSRIRKKNKIQRAE